MNQQIMLNQTFTIQNLFISKDMGHDSMHQNLHFYKLNYQFQGMPFSLHASLNLFFISLIKLKKICFHQLNMYMLLIFNFWHIILLLSFSQNHPYMETLLDSTKNHLLGCLLLLYVPSFSPLSPFQTTPSSHSSISMTIIYVCD